MCIRDRVCLGQKEVFDRLFGRPDVKVQADVKQLEKIVPPWMVNDEGKP